MRRLLLLLLVMLLSGCGQIDQVGVQLLPTQVRTAVELPTPTPEPLPPTPTFVPTAEANSPAVLPPLSLPTTVAGAPISVSGNSFRFEDTAWSGGWRNKGESRYKGRTATWIYGSPTSYTTMRVTFTLSTQPAGQADLQIEGMDGEDAAKTPILIQVNGVQIFRGPNPLPNDNDGLPGGTWALAHFPFAANLLHAGANTITIQNLAAGQVGLPPFFMLDYADLILQP